MYKNGKQLSIFCIMNRIPTRLEQDHLTNTVVSVSFETPYNFAYLKSNILGGLKKYGVEEYPLTKDKPKRWQKFDEATCYAYYDYKVIIECNKLSFNIVNKYKGWSLYSDFIKDTISALPPEGLIYNKIKINYISEFVDIVIFDSLDGNVNLDCYNNIYGAELRYPIVRKGCKGLVRITNLLPQKEGNISYMDISVMRDLRTDSRKELFTYLDLIHDIEKEEFYKILKEDFIKKLGPVYE